MRKTFSLRGGRRFGVFALVLPIVAAGAAGGSRAHAAVSRSSTTLTFVSWVGSQKTMKTFAAEFHKKNPTITVNFINVSSDSEEQKITTMIAGGTAPDAAYVDAGTVGDFASRGVLTDLNPYLQHSNVVKASEFVPAFRAMATYQGHMYALPFDGESTAIFYRKDLFQADGVKCCPKTWAQFQADAKKLTHPAKKQYGFGLFGQEAAYYWYPWLWSAGGHLVSKNGKTIMFDSKQGRYAANFYIGLRKYSPPDYWNSNSWDGRVAFPNGQAAMYEAGSWFGGTMISDFPKVKHKFGTFPIPVDKRCATDIAGDSLVVFKGSSNQDAAWKWAEFLDEKQNVELWNVGTPGSTELPPISSLLQSPSTFKRSPWLKGFASDMKCGVSETGRVAQWGQVEQDLDKTFTSAIYGKTSPAQALAQAAQQGRQVLSSSGG
jgi:multiple sugar transport system substrate-binding protein